MAKLEINALQALEVADFEFRDHGHSLEVFCIFPAGL
jgi:hypothetical protein